jgi:metallophosphoesterase (TIGR00282 family)
MKILFCGDVVGRSGREALFKFLPSLKSEFSLDGVIVNVENAAHGFGITPALCNDFLKHGVDVMTTGNHIWDQKEIIPYIDKEKRLVRPANYPQGTPGLGHAIFETQRGHKVLVINVMGRLFMDPLDDPFAALENLLSKYTLGANVQAIIVDVHAEATSEKSAFAHLFDGRVSCVVGTHTHIPTADGRIFPKGTAFQTDLGMCGDYNSIVGMDKHSPLHKFLRKMPPPERMKPAEGPGMVCGIVVDINETNGLARSIIPIRRGEGLSQV